MWKYAEYFIDIQLVNKTIIKFLKFAKIKYLIVKIIIFYYFLEC